METLFFVLVFFSSTLFAFINKNKPGLFLYLCFGVVTSLVVRISGFDVDIQNYSNAMQTISFDLYYAKESLIWIGQSFLYSLLNNNTLVFLIYDLLFFLILYLSLRNFSASYYLYFSIILFFPVFLGMQNIYRQLFGMVFVLYFFSIMYKNNKNLNYVSIVFSILSHNSAVIFIISLFALSKRSIRFFSYLFLLLLPVILMYSQNLKSYNDVGGNMEGVYFSIISLMTLSYFLLNQFKINLKSLTDKSYVLLFYLSMVFTFTLSSVPAERMFFFIFIFIFILSAVEFERRIKQKKIVRLMFIAFMSLPTFIFPSTLIFLS